MAFKPHYGQCIECSAEKTSLIVVKGGRCKYHNEKYKQQKKCAKSSLPDALQSTGKAKRLLCKEKWHAFGKLKKMVAERSRSSKKPAGQLSLFRKIWQTRPHRSQLSAHPILYFDVWCFGHILSKKAYPGFRLNPDNIILITRKEHIQSHNGDLPDRYKNILAEKAQKLKQQYYQNGDHQQKIQNTNSLV